MRLRVHALTDVGRERAQNEDSLHTWRDDETDVLVVCDGMGGHEAGEVASAIAVEKLIEELASGAPVREALVDANEAVVGESRARGTPTMGTTAVCARRKGKTLEVGWVGDSRFYLFRDGKIASRSVDHSRVQKLVELGFLTPDQARNHPDSHVLIQALGGGPGAQDAFDPSDFSVGIQKGDTLLLCSDGLYDMVEDEALFPLIVGKTPQRACEALVDAANAAGGWDNISVIVATVELDEVPHPSRGGPSPAMVVSGILLLTLGAVTAWKVTNAPADTASTAPATTPCEEAPTGMVCVPGGDTLVGGSSCSADSPTREAFVDTFLVDYTEVTNGAYRAWCEDDCSCENSAVADHSAPGQPALGVPLERARAFCEARGKRLPTGEEFQRAADRDGDGPLDCTHAVVSDPSGVACGAQTLDAELSGRPDEVARRSPSSFGVYDLLGNAPEWVDQGVVMGGDWTSDASCLSSSESVPEHPLSGFRCAADADADLSPAPPPPSLPRILTEPLPPEAWTEPLAGSWGAKDPAYADGQSYLSPQQLREAVWALHREHPSVTRVVHIADSRQGRPILALRITDNPSVDEEEPAVLLNGAHHGHELLSVDYAMDAARWLLDNDDVLAGRARSRLDVWVVPMVNPDGVFTTLHLDAGAKRGRKNGREVVEDCVYDPATEGVDLNRNYPFQWGGLGERGSSSTVTSPYYRGPMAGSEPETRALMGLNNAHRFVAAFSYHTNGNMVITPYTIEGLQNPTPSVAWMLAEQLAAASPDPYRVVSSMYPVDGTDQDWHYFKHGTLAYILEGSHHNPWDVPTRNQSRDGMAPLLPVLVDALLDGLRIDGVVTRDGEPVPAAIRLVQQEQHEGEMWTARARDGRFYRLVPEPGTYRVIADWDGRTVEADVIVSNGAAQVLLEF
jgi:serine/threonine protein phosphatase PrpC